MRRGDRGSAAPQRNAPERWEPDRWIDEGEVRDAAGRAVARGERSTTAARPVVSRTPATQQTPRGRARVPREVVDELTEAAGPLRGARLAQELAEARRAYERERYADARRLLVRLAEQAPTSAAVHELLGLTLYRLGRWSQAAAELEQFRTLTGSTEQHPVLADCYRALRRHGKVQELWDELRAASPSAALVAEGRIVAAGSLADRGRIDEALALLAPAVRTAPKVVQEHHLRLWYVVGDLSERAGDAPAARTWFERIAARDPDFGDVRQRLRELR